MKSFRFLSSLIVLGFFLASCAGEVDSKLEQIERHLDKAEYAQAEAKAREVLAEDADNNQAKYYLSGALIGQSVLQGKTFLGLFADLQEEQDTGESDTATFASIVPSLTDAELQTLRDATDIVDSIPRAERIENKDYALQLFVSKLFEISAEVERVGAGSEDVECNFNRTIQTPDGVPDALDPDGINNETRFENNIDTADTDREDAGLGDDFDLSGRLQDMSQALETAGNVPNFLKTEFGVSDSCPTP